MVCLEEKHWLMVGRWLSVDKERHMACEDCTDACKVKDEGIMVNINVTIHELHVVHEDQCTYIDNVHMDEDEGMDTDTDQDW
jgi:hypothetical protein